MNRRCEDHNSRDCGACHRPVRVTTGEADTLPAACEGELRDLSNAMRAMWMHDTANKLDAVIDRYSGLRPMRSDKRTP